MGQNEIRFTLNGDDITIRADPGRTLLHLLREDLDLTGTKQACDCEGECGACTVLVDGEAVRSCLTPICKVAGRSVVTIEGLGTAGQLHPVQQAFMAYGAVQCGYCTPGMILSAAALLDREPDPTTEQVLDALAGNLCRCTGYTKIVEAVRAAALVRKGGAERIAPEDERESPIVGGSQTRLDAVEKVTGAARYAEDIKMPGLLHAVLVRSTIPHARLLRVDPTSALQHPGVVSVVTAGEIPGVNSLDGYSRNEFLLIPVGESVRMVGDALAVVIGETPDAAKAGASAVRLDYEPLPHTFDAVSAMEPGAVAIDPDGNILNSHTVRHGDLESALSASDLILETRYETPFMEHSALERETVLSYLDEQDRVVVVAGHQEPHWAQGWIARLLGLPTELVRVVTPPMGGAFGGKQDPWPLMAGALAAYHVRRPVRLAYTRRESFDASPKRHPYHMIFQVGSTAGGSLTGLRLRIVANTGAHDSDGYYIPYYALVAGGGPYRWQAVDACAWSVYTNGPKAGQMRGFGTPQATLGIECTLDELAARLAIDPLELRLQNAIDGRTPTFLGYPPAETVEYQRCLEALRPRYREALARAEQVNDDRDGTPWRRGVGLAGMWYRFGKVAPITCEAQAELGVDGAVTFYFAAPDYGQGTTTVMAQIAADALGLPQHSLRLVNADTALTPDSGIQGASRSTYWVGGAVAQAAMVLRTKILGVAAEILDCDPDLLTLASQAVVGLEGAHLSLVEVAEEMERTGQKRRVSGVFAPQVGPDVRYDPISGNLPFFVTGAHLAEVDVNVATGEVQVVRVVAAHDVGRVVNPQGAQGQVEGAILMGVGAALMEEYLPGASTGFSDYYLPTIRCMPEIEVVFVEEPSRWGPHGAKGLGEAAALPTAPAILNGIYRASGGRVRQLPATPERVLNAIQRVTTAAPH